MPSHRSAGIQPVVYFLLIDIYWRCHKMNGIVQSSTRKHQRIDVLDFGIVDKFRKPRLVMIGEIRLRILIIILG